MGEVAVYIVLDYMENDIPPIESKHDPKFEIRFSQRWAAAELIDSMLDHPTEWAIDIIEDFIAGMTLYIRDCESKEMRRHFKIAQETAEDIILKFV